MLTTLAQKRNGDVTVPLNVNEIKWRFAERWLLLPVSARRPRSDSRVGGTAAHAGRATENVHFIPWRTHGLFTLARPTGAPFWPSGLWSRHRSSASIGKASWTSGRRQHEIRLDGEVCSVISFRRGGAPFPESGVAQ